MSEQTDGYPLGPVWRVVASDTAAGYERDALGDWVLVGLVVFGPSTGKLRGMRLRDLERPAINVIALDLIWQEQPPTADQIANSWANRQALVRLHQQAADGYQDWVAGRIAESTRAEDLTRGDGDSPEDFYRRVARAHAFLSLATKRPTAELARKAGVPTGTAAAWVSRARSRGLFDEVQRELEQQP